MASDSVVVDGEVIDTQVWSEPQQSDWVTLATSLQSGIRGDLDDEDRIDVGDGDRSTAEVTAANLSWPWVTVNRDGSKHCGELVCLMLGERG